ncbi:hypothetical protein [Bradyrhizobium yuanmingense]|uniref:hypothetical protein n=1 Tax=Bradyrhizobium yuanmingense TaxID=108015 RepID=UPI0006844C20|nr:hypothetical protein [Bradyrhizobium yuanmingense]
MDDLPEVPHNRPRGAGIQPPKNGRGLDWPLPRLDDQVWSFVKTKPRTFAPQGNTPLTWWRSSPAQSFRDHERSIVDTTLRQIAVINCADELADALRGDANATIAVAHSLMPFARITLHADIAATALLPCALSGNASAALVLAQFIGLGDVHLLQPVKLATSWLEHGDEGQDRPPRTRGQWNLCRSMVAETTIEEAQGQELIDGWLDGTTS